MSVFRHLALVFSMVAAASCYKPDWPDGQLKCATDSECPNSEFTCVAGVCKRGVGTTDQDLAASSEDLSIVPSDVDMRMSSSMDLTTNSQDLRVSNDLSTMTTDMRMGPDMMGPSGCRNPPGQSLNGANSVWACKGNFGSGRAGDVCASGYHVCSYSRAGDMIAVGLSTGPCNNGFYVIDANIGVRSNNSLRCDGPDNNEKGLLVGCGSENGTLPLSTYTTCGALGSIPLLNASFLCGTAGKPWNCSQNNYDSASHNSTMNEGGALCCRD